MSEAGLISEEYRAMQQQLHQNPDYGVASVHDAPLVAQVIEAVGAQKLLDYGAGKGRLGQTSVFLRVIGTEAEKASNWESSSGGFDYRYMRALMLPDAPKSHDHPVMLIERQEIGMRELCEVMVGEHSRHIQLLELIEEGADYMRVAFVWKTPAAH